MCEGVQYLHDKKIIHRDLKPDIVFIDNDPDTNQPIPIIADMGLCKEMEEMTRTHSMVGTKLYFSPEQIKEESYSYPTDVFALGLILYEMCTLSAS